MVRTPRKSKLNLLALAATLAVVLAGWISIGSITSSTAGNVGGMSLSSPTKTEKAPRFGFRTLREGMSGDDVRILKGLAKSQDYLGGSLSTGTADASSRRVASSHSSQKRASTSTGFASGAEQKAQQPRPLTATGQYRL